MSKTAITRVFLLLAMCFIMGGCSLLDAFLMPEPEMGAQDLFEYGNDAMREKDYARSIRYFTKLKENYPFSPYVTEAELSLADSYYLDDDWLMAADAYMEFEAMHPRHQAIPYVLYQIGMSNMRSYTSIDRPPTQVHEAISYFNRLRDSFPGDEYAEKAEAEIQNCRRLLAEYEIYMADFFFRTERYRAAWTRYSNVIRDYQDITDLYEYAAVQVNAAYSKHVEQESEQTRREREGTWRKWFDWL